MSKGVFQPNPLRRRESSLYPEGTIPIFMAMTAAPRYQARRATVEDLPQLTSLWQLEQLPAPALEKRFKEFQVVSDDTGQILGAIGLQVSGNQGLLHSESMARPEVADQVRETLWTRLQAMIHNHALERLWSPIITPYWRAKGFSPASPQQQEGVPPEFRDASSSWHVLTLRTPDESAAIEREFARMQALQQKEKAKMQATVAWMKRAAFVALFFLMIIAAGAIVVVRYAPHIFRR
jgi:N-acetylglutamate synthase-like GNAT family acetyltransferase